MPMQPLNVADSSKGCPPRIPGCRQLRKEVTMARGMLVFRSIGEALKAGFQIYDRTPNGYIARAKIDGYWQMALIEC
jgi:hypothetical protein